jgi:hypothetical protein
MTQRSIEQVLAEHSSQWMSISGVEGLGIGLRDESPCIMVFVSVEPEQVRAQVPRTVENYPVVIDMSGGFRALD